MSNTLLRGITKDGKIRFFILNSTELVEKARKIHSTSPISSAALGRTLTATSLIGSMAKNKNEKVTLQIKGSNEIKSILAVSDSSGNVKAYISNPNVETKLNEFGKLAVGEAVGKEGELILIRDLGLKDPYVGQSKLVSGEIAEDIASYFMFSEQQPTVVSLGVFVDSDLSIASAGGFIIQPLPDTEEEILEKLENNIINLDSMSNLLKTKNNLEEILDEIFKEFEYKILDRSVVDFKCDCSKDKMKRGLISIGKEEIKKIIDEDKKAELVCHFCNSKYNFTLEELNEIYAETKF